MTETGDLFEKLSGNVNSVPFENRILDLVFRAEGVKIGTICQEYLKCTVFSLHENPIGFRFALLVPEIFAFEKNGTEIPNFQVFWP